jgi:hypothetical protein
VAIRRVRGGSRSKVAAAVLAVSVCAGAVLAILACRSHDSDRTATPTGTPPRTYSTGYERPLSDEDAAILLNRLTTSPTKRAAR